MNKTVKITLAVVTLVAMIFYLYLNSVFAACLYYPGKSSFAFERNNISLPENKQIVVSSMLIAEDESSVSLNPYVKCRLPKLDHNEILLVVEDTDPVYSIEVAGQIIKPTCSFLRSVFDPNGAKSYFFIAPKDIKGHFYTYRTFDSEAEEQRAQNSMLDILSKPNGGVYYDFYQINGKDSIIYVGDFDIPKGVKDKVAKPKNDEMYLIIETPVSNIGAFCFDGFESKKYIYKFNYYGSSIYRYLFIVPKDYEKSPENNFKLVPVDPNTII